MNSNHASAYMDSIAIKFWAELTRDEWEDVACTWLEEARAADEAETVRAIAELLAW
jgi:hypothetical protein